MISKEVIAGFFIGDGHWRKQRDVIVFTQKNPKILRAIQEVYGGRLSVKHGYNRKPCHELMLRTEESKRFCQELGHHIRPYKDLPY